MCPAYHGVLNMDLFRRLFNQPSAEVAEKNKAAAPKDEAVNGEKVTEPFKADVQEPTDTATPPAAMVNDGATRPLPLESVISTKNRHLRFGQSTDVGMVRNNKQDSVLSLFH